MRYYVILDKNNKIISVGCNSGNKLRVEKEMSEKEIQITSQEYELLRISNGDLHSIEDMAMELLLRIAEA